MVQGDPLIRNVSDTALWVAAYRAQESALPDAAFKDPFAKKLAGQRGQDIAANQAVMSNMLWPFTARTWLIDKLIKEQITRGTNHIINLAAGLDMRPYRMQLPSDLVWTEIDLPGILDYKESVISKEEPNCKLRRIRCDLSNEKERSKVFHELANDGTDAMVISEGLLIYLSYDEVNSLASDIHALKTCHSWIIDIVSPGLMKMMKEKMDEKLDDANASFKFAPVEGSRYFLPFGWHTKEELSIFKTARKLGRLSFFMGLLALLPEREKDRVKRPWSGVIHLSKANKVTG